MNKYKAAAHVRGFYDIPYHKEGSMFAGDNLSGSLNEELFDNFDKKIAYLQGVFEDLSEGIGITRGKRNENTKYSYP